MKRMRLARIKIAPSHQILEDKQRMYYAYWEAIAEETEGAAVWGATKKPYQMLKSLSRRPAEVGEVSLKRDGSVVSDQAVKQC